MLLDVCQQTVYPSYMSRPRHPNKHIEAAVQHAESLGWLLRKSKGHAWGHLYCPLKSRAGCIVSVYSTPRVPENHARHIRRDVDMCPHNPIREGDRGNQEEEG